MFQLKQASLGKSIGQLNRKKATMKLQLPIELVNQILGYLGARPYQEVYALIQGIQEAAKPPTDVIPHELPQSD